MKNTIYIFTILLFGFALIGNAQQYGVPYPELENCNEKYPNTASGSRAWPDGLDPCEDPNDAYATCLCRNSKAKKEYQEKIVEINKDFEHDNNRIKTLEKGYNSLYKQGNDIHSKLLRNNDYSGEMSEQDFYNQKKIALEFYRQARASLSYYSGNSLLCRYNEDFCKRIETQKKWFLNQVENDLQKLEELTPRNNLELILDNSSISANKQNSSNPETANSNEIVNLRELKSNLYETKAMLERTGQTNTEAYRQTVEGIKVVELQQNRNSFSSNSNALTSKAYSNAAAATGQLVGGFAQAYQDGTFSALRLFYTARDFQGTNEDGEDILIQPLFRGTFGLGIGKKEVAMFTLQANFDEGYTAAVGLEFTILPRLLKVFDGEKDISLFSIGLKTEIGWGEGDPESNEITTIYRTDTFFYGGGVFVTFMSDIFYAGYIYGKASGTDAFDGDYNDFYSGYSVGLNIKF